MLTLITQDGRTFEMSHEYSLFISGYLKNENNPAQLKASLFTKTKWDNIPFSQKLLCSDYVVFPARELIASFGVIGEFATDTGFIKARDALREAWENGATEFIVPQDTFEKSDAEKFEDFCEENNLTCVSINELGYSPADIPRNLHIWRQTDEFERRNILVCDPDTHSFDKSLAKWKALHTA